MKTKIISVILCLGVILALTVVPGTPPVKVALAQSHIGVNVTPQQTTVGFSESFNVVVWIDDSLAENYDGVGIRLVYNTSYVTATGVTDAGTFDWVLDAGTINNSWSPTQGLVKYDAANMAGPLNTSNPVCTVSFTSNSSNTGISGLNFIYIGADAATSVTLMGSDILNWTYVVNGTVRSGMPALTVNVTPAGKGTVKADGTTLTGYPNTTTWDWDDVVNLTAVNSTLGWGFYNWSGDLISNDNPESITMDDFTKNVTANFMELPPAISPDPTNLNFSGNVGEAVANKTLQICNGGGGILNWMANITGANATLFSMSPMSGGNLTAAQCSNSTVAVNITGLTAGTYHANITITETVPYGDSDSMAGYFTNGGVTPAVVLVTLNLGVPEISASPTPLTFTTSEGEDPPDQTLEVCNTGTGTLDWSLSEGATWLSVSPTSGGNLGHDDCNSTEVSVDASGLAAGDYSATITITGPGASNTPQSVSVSLHIESGMPPMPVTPAAISCSGLSISQQQVQPGQEVTISVIVTNSGGETGSYNAVLYINGAVEDSQSVSVPGGTGKNVIFTVSKSKAGVYDVSVCGQSGQFQVVGGGGWFAGGLGTGGIIAIVVIVIVLIVALVFILRGTTRPE